MGGAISAVLKPGDPPPSLCHPREVYVPNTATEKIRALAFRHHWRSNFIFRSTIFIGMPVLVLWFWGAQKIAREPMHYYEEMKKIEDTHHHHVIHEECRVQERADHLYFASLGKYYHTYSPLEGYKHEYYQWEY